MSYPPLSSVTFFGLTNLRILPWRALISVNNHPSLRRVAQETPPTAPPPPPLALLGGESPPTNTPGSGSTLEECNIVFKSFDPLGQLFLVGFDRKEFLYEEFDGDPASGKDHLPLRSGGLGAAQSRLSGA